MKIFDKIKEVNKMERILVFRLMDDYMVGMSINPLNFRIGMVFNPSTIKIGTEVFKVVGDKEEHVDLHQPENRELLEAAQELMRAAIFGTEIVTRCVYCGGKAIRQVEHTEAVYGNYRCKADGFMWVCKECGKSFYDAKECERLRNVAKLSQALNSAANA